MKTSNKIIATLPDISQTIFEFEECRTKTAVRTKGFRGLNFDLRWLSIQTMTGNSTMNFAPRGVLLTALILPRCSETMRWTIAKPKPVPRPLVEK